MNNLRNSVRLTGFLGGDPEIKLVSDEKKVVHLRLATLYYHKNGAGEMVNETHWHQLVLWGSAANVAETYLNKGSQITIEGRLANRFYTDPQGNKKYVTEVIVNELMMLDKKTQN